MNPYVYLIEANNCILFHGSKNGNFQIKKYDIYKAVLTSTHDLCFRQK